MSSSPLDLFPDPKLIIIAGPNGSGKTTLTNELFNLDELDAVKLNADDRAAAIRAADPGAENPALDAAKEIDAALDDCVANKQSVLVETVLSSGKYRERVLEAKRQGMFVIFIFVTLENPDLNVARVAQRVSESGHDVPEDKIRLRYGKSHNEALTFFMGEADVAMFYDNTTEAAELFTIIDGKLFVGDGPRAQTIFPGLRKALREIGLELPVFLPKRP